MKGHQKLLSRAFGLVFLVVALVLSIGIVALAQGEIELGATPIEATLQGNNGGAFHHYKVLVPADTQVHIQLWFGGVDELLGPAFGVNVFGSDGSEGQAVPVEDGDYLEFSFRHDDPQTLTAVVFNYTDRAIAYTLKVDGLPMMAAAAPSAALPATGASMDMPVAPVGGESMSGTLLGREGGAFAKFPLAYSGDEEDVIVELALSPEDPTWGERLGVEIYNPEGRKIGTGTPTDTLGIRKVTFASDLAGEYTIVVFNYAEGLPLLYSVEVTR